MDKCNKKLKELQLIIQNDLIISVNQCTFLDESIMMKIITQLDDFGKALHAWQKNK